MTEVAQLCLSLIDRKHIFLLGEDCRFTTDTHTAEFNLLVGVEYSHSDHMVIARTEFLSLLLRVRCLLSADPRLNIGMLGASGVYSWAISTLQGNLIILLSLAPALVNRRDFEGVRCATRYTT